MDFKRLLTRVEPTWHKVFINFVETGEADPEFLAYLDRDEGCQEAVELAFAEQATAFETLAQALKTAQAFPPEEAARARRAETVSAGMAISLEGALELPPDERRQAVRQVAAALKGAMDPKRRADLDAIVEELRTTVAQSG